MDADVQEGQKWVQQERELYYFQYKYAYEVLSKCEPAVRPENPFDLIQVTRPLDLIFV